MDVPLDHHAPVCAEDDDSGAMSRRLFRVMCCAVAVSVAASAAFAPWRVTTGLALGGALALLNHHWLRTSVRAAFASASLTGLRPKLSAARFVLRYFVVTASVIAAYEFGVVSIVATLVGLSAFVVAGVVEGFFQTYLIFVHREEN
ncbi:MAG: ATP synthase subunit I [Pyrinomonadaceae bacterium]